MTDRNIDISDKARALHALAMELQKLEGDQLDVASKIGELFVVQCELSKRCGVIRTTMMAILKDRLEESL